MTRALVVREKSLRNVVKNNYGEFMKEEDLDQIIAGLLVRISSLESQLISKGVIDRDEYTTELSVRIKEIQSALEKVKGGGSEALLKNNDKKLLS